MGRPTVYNQATADEICRLIAEGLSLSEACRRDGMPPRQTVSEWVLDDREGFASQYARARDLQIERWADEVLTISDDASNDWMERNQVNNPGWQHNGEHVQRSRLRTDNRRWLLSKLRPEKYGDKVIHAGDAEHPVNVLTRINLVPVEPQRVDPPQEKPAAVEAIKWRD